MTNEQAIEIIRKEYLCVDRDCDIERSCGKCPYMMPTKEPILEAYKMAIQSLSQEATDIVSRGAFEQVMRAFDIAVGQLKELGYGLGQKIKPCDDAISRDAVFNAIEHEDKWLLDAKGHNGLTEIAFSGLKARVDALPSVTQKSETVTEFADRCRECGSRYGKLLKQKSGKWIDYRDDGFVECPFCGHATNCEDDIDELHYCFYCGAKMVEPQESEE